MSEAKHMTIHSCSYYCHQPECIKVQRDELRDKLYQRTWVGLTIENIVALFPNEFLHSTYDTEKLISDVRIVDSALKEKNSA